MKLIWLGLLGLALVALLEAVPVANEGEEMHDLETAEIILKIIEHKIYKLYKKCLKLGGCRPNEYTYEYGYDNSYSSPSYY